MRDVRLGGRTVRIADDQPTFWDRVEAGTWEPGTLALYAAQVGPGTLVIDVGAWVGPLVLLAAALAARVVAVEADPAAFAQLGRNLAANPDLARRVTALPRAASAGSEPVRLGARRKPGDSMSSALLAETDPEAWTADAVTPAEFAGHLRPGERLFLKLDIEGGEYGLLPALAGLLDRPGAALLVSLHPAVLAETGESDPAGRALAALAPFRSWPSAAVTPGSLVPTALSRATLGKHDAWFLRRPT